MIEYFRNSVSDVMNVFVDQGIYIEARLKENEHIYYYSNVIELNERKWSMEDFYACMIASGSLPVSFAVIFYDKNMKKLDGVILPPNQMKKIDVGVEAVFAKMALRVVGKGECRIANIFCGPYKSVSPKVNEAFSFPQTALSASADLLVSPLVLVETLFCDVETDENILERYFSYFCGLFRLMESQTYKEFFWMISLSSDKKNIASRLDKMISSSTIKDRIYLNIYTHPESGYGNEAETHIDRLKKPNVTIPCFRDVHSNGYMSWVRDRIKDFESRVLVRLAIDDDDFIAPHHISVVAGAAIWALGRCSSGQAIVGFERIGVVYNKLNSFTVEVATFSKMLTGAKFSVRFGAEPLNPYSITENFPEVNDNQRNDVYLKYTPDFPTFFYNRHGANLSNANKKSFYLEELSRTSDLDETALLRYISNGCYRV